jgi:hypothetical protein
MYWQRTILLAALTIALTAAPALAQTGPPEKTPPQPSSGLVGTDWTGSETLGGFGALTFQFRDQGKAIMIDTQGNWPGTFVQDAQEVTIKFFNGDVIYRGKITGKDMAGSAENKAGGKWTFKVSLKDGSGGVVVQPSESQALTPETLPAYLKKIGFEPRLVTPASGVPYCVINVKDNDGWNFEVEVAVATGGGSTWLRAQLAKLPPVGEVPAASLLQLLEANQRLAPCFFAYRIEDNRLNMSLESIGKRPTEQEFRGDLQLLTNQVRRTYALWNAAEWKKAAN